MNKKLLFTTIALMLIIAFSTFGLIACNDVDDPNGVVEINVCVPDGSPAIAIAKMVKDNPTFDGYKINYEVVSGSEGIGARLASGQATIAIAPTNAGATQYNKNNGKYKLLATAVQGALYMVGKESLSGETTQQKLSSLKGNTVYNIGQGQTPDLTFRYILDYYDIPYQISETESPDYVALRYVGAGSELIPMLKMGTAKYGILGEPAVTNANAKASTTTIFSIQDLWNDVTSTEGGFPQASVFINQTIANGEHDQFLNWFIDKLTESANWVGNNPSDGATALASAGSTSLTNLNSNMVAKCNISIIKSQDAKQGVNTYLTALYGFNPQTVGGSIPNDAFFYSI